MIRILTDSASDILPAEAEQLGVTVIPLNVTLEDGTVLRDGIDKTPSEYYALLKECHKLPTTSQPSPELFERFYQDAAAAGDEVLGIFLSHELSGTWQCARLAADLVNVDNVLFVDSANVCLGEGLLVRLAVQLRAAGKTLVQIATDLEHAKEHLHLVAAIDDLKYLRKGGRLPAAVAVAGGMLGIKPLITIKEGKVAMAGKARGLPGAYVALFKKIEELGGVDTILGGVGCKGLIGWNERPISNVHHITLEQYANSKTRAVHMTDETIIAYAEREFGGCYEALPPNGITIGMKSMLTAKRAIFIVMTGSWKETVVRVAMFSEPTVEYPVTLFPKYVPQCIMCCDRKTADHVISREYQDAPILR